LVALLPNNSTPGATSLSLISNSDLTLEYLSLYFNNLACIFFATDLHKNQRIEINPFYSITYAVVVLLQHCCWPRPSQKTTQREGWVVIEADEGNSGFNR
jgi:hypothetical protein